MNEKSAFEVVLTSDSSLKIFKNNVLSEFSVFLPETLSFSPEEKWGVAVSQIILPPVSKPANLNENVNKDGEVRSPVFLYVSIIEPQIVSDTVSKIARVLPPAYTSQFYQYRDLHYIPLNCKEIQVVSVSLRDKFGNRYPFPDSVCSTVITLRFKRLS